MTGRITRALTCVIVAAITATAGAAAEAQSLDSNARLNINIEAQGAGSALVALGNQAGVQISVAQSIGDRITLAPISGEYTLREALEKMLVGSGLTYRFVSGSSVVVSQAELQEQDSDGDSNDASADDANGAEDVRVADEIVVTGSLLKQNPGELDRQLATYDRLEIEASGATTVEEFLRNIPQSFDAPTSTGGTFAGNFGSTANFFGAAGVNLRGLSARATLVLIDGKRTGRGGVLGEAVDLNTIPLSQVERFEIIYDGASSLYGADAVGGVVNIITRKDYQGYNINVVHSVPEDGGTDETNITLGGSFSWGSGSVTASVQTFQRDALNGDERALRFATTLDLAALPPGSPGNIEAIEVFDSGVGGFVLPPLFLLDANGNAVPLDDASGVTEVFRTQIPGGTDGTGLTLADFAGRPAVAGSRPEAGLGLIPGRDDQAIRINARQEITDWLMISGGISYLSGDNDSLESNQTLRLNINPESRVGPIFGHPGTPFANPVDVLIEIPYFPDTERFTEKEQLDINLALDGELSESWRWTLSAAKSRSDNDGTRLNVLSPLSRNCLSFPNLPSCAENGLDGINVFADPFFGLASEQAVIDRLIIPTAETINDSTDESYELTFRGDLFEWAGGTSRALFGVGRRTEKSFLFDSTGTISRIAGALPALNFGVAEIGNSPYSETLRRKTEFVKGEINVPLIGEANSLPGVRTFDFTVSARYDDIDSLGGRETRTRTDSSFDTTTIFEGRPRTLNDSNTAWSAGIVWQVNDWLRVRANANEAFATPPLSSYVVDTSFSEFPSNVRDENDERIPLIFVSGGNPELQPEQSKSRSFGFEFTPTAIPDLFVSVNFHSNRINNRIGNFSRPNIEMLDDLNLNRLDLSIDEDTGLFLQDRRMVNLGRVHTRGFDVDSIYQFDTGFGNFDVRLNYAYLDKNDWFIIDDCGENNLSCSDAYFDQPVTRVGTSERVIADDGRSRQAPLSATPRHRGTLRFGWQLGGLRADLTKTYSSDTTTELVRSDPNLDPTDGANTVKPANPIDLVLSYDFDRAGTSSRIFKGTRVSLAVPNILNDNARFILTPQFPSDAAGVFSAIESRPRGRTYTLRLEKRFE